jgi:arylsulfatase A-like enzyme
VAPAGAPNVLYIVLDDVGFSAMEPWGGLIETPNINKLAANWLTYTNWHTTALCSPTRSSLLTGRNHTTNKMACIVEATAGVPNANGDIPFECATIAEVLVERGWKTYMLGKWHLCSADEMNLASTQRNWPDGRGFERYYGFLGGETNQWYPDLVYENHPVEQPSTPEEEYRGRFDMGYEAHREQVFARQKKLGIFPAAAELSPLNPYAEETSVEGKAWPALDVTRPRDSLNDERRLFSRMAEVYAGFLSHINHEIGRLLDSLEQICTEDAGTGRPTQFARIG